LAGGRNPPAGREVGNGDTCRHRRWYVGGLRRCAA